MLRERIAVTVHLQPQTVDWLRGWGRTSRPETPLHDPDLIGEGIERLVDEALDADKGSDG